MVAVYHRDMDDLIEAFKSEYPYIGRTEDGKPVEHSIMTLAWAIDKTIGKYLKIMEDRDINMEHGPTVHPSSKAINHLFNARHDAKIWLKEYEKNKPAYVPYEPVPCVICGCLTGRDRTCRMHSKMTVRMKVKDE